MDRSDESEDEPRRWMVGFEWVSSGIVDRWFVADGLRAYRRAKAGSEMSESESSHV